MKKRFLSVVLTICILVSASLPVSARETDFFDENFVPVPIDEQTWDKVDTTEFYELYELLENACKNNENPTDVMALCEKMDICAEKLMTESVFCDLDYYKDPEKYGEDYQAWAEAMRNVLNDYVIITREVVENGYGDAYKEHFGEEDYEAVLNAPVYTDEQLALLNKETELVMQYSLASTKALSNKALNEIAVPILIDLIEIRNTLAKTCGYDNYADYAYDTIYSRGYTSEEIRSFHEEVKEYMVPIYEDLDAALYHNNELDFSNIGLNGLSEAEVLDTMEPWLDDISDEFLATFNYMKEYKLYDIEASPTKLEVGFTTNLYYYDSAYIFNNPYGNYYDVMTMIHEFGHFANAVLAGDGATVCYDVCEIHSQGLEMLYTFYADEMVGENGGDAYRAKCVDGMLYSIIDGALYDEFQQVIYTMENPTVQKINEAFKTISEEYGYFYSQGETQAYDWVYVNHTFESPFYYISYATSALGALEILSMANEDFEKGADAYLKLVAQQYVDGYCDAVAEAGLSDATKKGSVKSVCEKLTEYLYDEVYDITFTEEIKGHWAEAVLLDAGKAGVFKGDEGGRVNPDKEMTVAEAITVLWRLNGCDTGYANMYFADVNYTDWYYDAVDWFVTRLQEDEVYTNMEFAGRFGADERISRATFIWMYAFVNSAYEPEEDYLDKYTDGHTVPEGCRSAMNWAIELGIIKGYDNGELAPDRYLTRAEIAQILLG